MHAIEITLTRTVEVVELKAAQQESSQPVTAADNRRGIVILLSARDERRAMRKI